MSLAYDDGWAKLYIADASRGLAALPAESVHTCITSPPYFGLRSYLPADHPDKAKEGGTQETPELYVEWLVEVFRGVWRVLRDDGTLWLNLGDSYAMNFSGGKGRKTSTADRWGADAAIDDIDKLPRSVPRGLKPKDLLMVPARVALALQQPYVVPTCVQSETDRAWLAAIFDGEGCIGIRRYDSYREDVRYQDGFVVYTVVTNNDIELLERCVDITANGKVAIKQRAETTDNRGIKSRKDSYGWRLDGNAAVDVIRAIYPYLIAKRRQACVAYSLDVINKNKRRVDGVVPKEDQDKKRYLYDTIKALNQRETITLPNWVTEPRQEVQPGWYLRSQIVWTKPNPMPESVTDRPTQATEMVYLFSKKPRYFYDAEAVKETSQDTTGGGPCPDGGPKVNTVHPFGSPRLGRTFASERGGRNLRNYWQISTRGYPGSHYATFPPELPLRCIKAGTSEKGVCSECGAPWRRVVERPKYEPPVVEVGERNVYATERSDPSAQHRRKLNGKSKEWQERIAGSRTIGFEPTCSHDADTIPATVLDPFSGSGTTLLVARKLGRRSIGIDIDSRNTKLLEERMGYQGVLL